MTSIITYRVKPSVDFRNSIPMGAQEGGFENQFKG